MLISRSSSTFALCVSLLTVSLAAQTPTVASPQEPDRVNVGAERPAAPARGDQSGPRPDSPTRSPAELIVPAPKVIKSAAGTPNRVAKFAADGSLIDSAIVDANNSVS